MTLKNRIIEHLKEKEKPYDDVGVKVYLEYLYHELGLRTSQIGEKFGVGQATVRFLMRKLGIEMKAPGGGISFMRKLREAGYVSEDDYFGRNVSKAKVDMAKELGVSYSSLCNHYDKWADTFSKSES